MALQKYIIFTPIFRSAVENHLKGHLGVLRNLGQHTSHNTTCTSSPKKIQTVSNIIYRGEPSPFVLKPSPFMSKPMKTHGKGSDPPRFKQEVVVMCSSEGGVVVS